MSIEFRKKWDTNINANAGCEPALIQQSWVGTFKLLIKFLLQFILA